MARAGDGRRSSTSIFGIFGLIGIGLLGGAAYMAYDTRRDLAVGVTTDGTVVDLIGERDSDGDTTYHPRVRFVTRSGEAREFTASVGTNPAAFEVGEPVVVIYDPASPEGARIDSFFQLWFAPLLLGGMGIVFAAFGCGAVVAGRRRREVAADPSASPVPAPNTSAVERRSRD